MAEYTNLGKFLKQKRIERNFTQAEIAAKLGDVHSQFVSNWERGLCAPPGHSFHTLISLLKINREALVDVMLQDEKEKITMKVYKKGFRKAK